MDTPRLDNIINNSHELKERLLNAQVGAKRQVEWANSHFFVSSETGEVLMKEDGERLTAADVSRSWYLKSGGRNNARVIVERLKKTLDHSADVASHRPKFVTLTFRDALPSWEIERAIQKFLNAVRTWAKRRGIDTLAYFWTAEVQERGALHYHIIFLGLPFIPKKQWRTWWQFGFIDARAVDDLGRVFKYLAKYLWKWGKMAEDAERLPEWWYYFSVFAKRRYGFSNWFRLPLARRVPAWLRNKMLESNSLDRCVKAERAAGGGWHLEFYDLEHNKHFSLDFPSPYRIVASSG